jgi:hypothetical protein
MLSEIRIGHPVRFVIRSVPRLYSMKRLVFILLAFMRPADADSFVPDPATMNEIKAYCLDFNWQGKGRKSKIADPAS